MQEDILVAVPTRKVYKEATIAIAAFMAGPLAGGVLMAENFRSLGKSKAATTAIVLSFLFTVLIFLSVLVPATENIPTFLYSILYAIVASLVTRRFQKKEIEAHIAQGGLLHSGWRAFGISIICLIVMVAAMFGMLYLMDPEAW